ncbi:unnamed protein product [Closterium sp. Yama58-4]|nr:unnamed protein product [Closterium sp. Yama58-4]
MLLSRNEANEAANEANEENLTEQPTIKEPFFEGLTNKAFKEANGGLSRTNQRSIQMEKLLTEQPTTKPPTKQIEAAHKAVIEASSFQGLANEAFKVARTFYLTGRRSNQRSIQMEKLLTEQPTTKPPTKQIEAAHKAVIEASSFQGLTIEAFKWRKVADGAAYYQAAYEADRSSPQSGHRSFKLSRRNQRSIQMEKLLTEQPTTKLPAKQIEAAHKAVIEASSFQGITNKAANEAGGEVADGAACHQAARTARQCGGLEGSAVDLKAARRSAKQRGGLQVSAADFKAARRTSWQRGGLEGSATECKAPRRTARQRGGLQGSAADLKAARWT